MNVATLGVMVNKRRRTFGTVVKLPVCHYRARYFYQGVFHNAPETYRTVTDANSWLTVEEARILQGTWVPIAGTAMTVSPCWCSRYSAVLLGVRKQHGGICRTSNTYHSGYGSLMPCGKQEKALHWSLSSEDRSPAHASLFPAGEQSWQIPGQVRHAG